MMAFKSNGGAKLTQKKNGGGTQRAEITGHETHKTPSPRFPWEKDMAEKDTAASAHLKLTRRKPRHIRHIRHGRKITASASLFNLPDAGGEVFRI
ncbi:MAG: hypothetical protein ISR48_08355 [Alphaproteobacteria bacterium]|nr:hypothetical protein [Alphaproteobacteria bacterium]